MVSQKRSNITNNVIIYKFGSNDVMPLIVIILTWSIRVDIIWQWGRLAWLTGLSNWLRCLSMWRFVINLRVPAGCTASVGPGWLEHENEMCIQLNTRWPCIEKKLVMWVGSKNRIKFFIVWLITATGIANAGGNGNWTWNRCGWLQDVVTKLRVPIYRARSFESEI